MTNEPLARPTDPHTSHEATHFDPSTVEAKIYNLLMEVYPEGLIFDEIVEELKLRPGTISPRFKPMREKRFIKWKQIEGQQDTYEKRLGTAGRGQIVWYAVLPEERKQ